MKNNQEKEIKQKQLTKELKGLIVPNHQYKKWQLKDLTIEQLISLEKTLEKEYTSKTKEPSAITLCFNPNTWSKELKKVLHSLYPGLHACCLLRIVKERIEQSNQKTLNNPSNQQLAKYLSQTLSNQKKNKEEKVEEIVNFCLDYLNQGVKENWRQKRNRTHMLLTLAENEWKNTKKEAFKEIINEGIIEKIKF